MTFLGPSWIPKLGGIAIVTIAVIEAIGAVVRGQPVNWTDTVTHVTVGSALLGVRQNNVTSEAAGAKPDTQ